MKLHEILEQTTFFKRLRVNQKQINEGLITTWPVDVVVPKLKAAGIKTDIKNVPSSMRTTGIMVTGIDLQVFNGFESAADDLESFKKIKQITTAAGYFPSMVAGARKIGNQYDINTPIAFDESMEPAMITFLKSNPDNSLILSYEAKFDIEFEFGALSELYHATPKIIYEKRISKIGLSPRHHNKLSNHPDRVYFSLSKDAAFDIAKVGLKNYSKYDDFVVLTIDTKLMPKNTRIFIDQNFWPYGCYIHTNVSPKAITNVDDIE